MQGSKGAAEACAKHTSGHPAFIDIIAEYVALKEAAIRRDSYLQRNQALQEIDNIIARHSDCGSGAHQLAAQVGHQALHHRSLQSMPYTLHL